MTQSPTYYCSKCHTTRPPLVSGRTYTCVMCGKSRSAEEFREELAKLRAAAENPKPWMPSVRPRPEPPTVARPVEPEPAAKPAPLAKEKPAKQPEAQAAPAPKKAVDEAVDEAPASTADDEDPNICAWKDCDNIPRPKSKYCGRACSNKNARHRHAKRRTEAA
jgi:hypothetical protein